MSDCEQPPLPPPLLVLAEWMERRAWDDDVGDYDRQLLEMGANAIRQSVRDNFKDRNRTEHLEACLDAFRRSMGGAS